MSWSLVAEIAFWMMLFLIFWTYFGYYFFLKFISLFRDIEVKKADYFPEVSLIITAYNEEINIADKIENSLDQNYPPDKLKVIVASDGSDDKTLEIASRYEPRGIEAFECCSHQGKHFCQGEAIKKSTGEIIILTDVSTMLSKNAVKTIVSNFNDSTIGCVSGMDQIPQSEVTVSGEFAYVGYEMGLRSLESKVNSLIGASGSFYAVRKILCTDWRNELSNDFYMPIVARMRGLRTVLDQNATGYYDVAPKAGEEFQRKVRTIVHGIEALFAFKQILNPFKYGFFSFQMFSHKLLRWLVPFLLIITFVLNVFLFHNHPFYKFLLSAQIILSFCAVMACIIYRLRDFRPFRIPYFFSLANVSIMVAWYKFFTGERYRIWNVTQR